MKRKLYKLVTALICIGIVINTNLSLAWAQSLDTKILENTKEYIVTKTEPIVKTTQNVFQNISQWITQNLSLKLKIWWEEKGKPFFLSLWYQFLTLLNKEIIIR